jgi:DNA-binding transcriptional LysR family regulator
MSTAVDLRHLRYFVAVAEELSFTRAAIRLGMAQPPLSQQVRQLEQIVGSPLLERRPRVALTEAGQVLLEVARRTLAQVGQGLDAAGRTGRGMAGRLTIGFTSSIVFTPLLGAFSLYTKRYPGVELQLREMHSAAQINALRAGTIDVGLFHESPGDDDLASDTVLREPFMALLPANHPLAEKSRLAPRALAGEPFVLFPRAFAPMLYDQIAAICRAGDFVPQVRHEAADWPTMTALVGVGMGVSIAPARVQQLRWRGVAYRPLQRVSIQTSIFVCRRREPVRAAVEGVVQVLRRATVKVSSSHKV